MRIVFAWVISLTGFAAAGSVSGPVAALRDAVGTRVTDVRAQSVVVGDFKPDASFAFTMKDGRRVSGHVIAREYPVAEAPALWVRDLASPELARALLPTPRGFVELTVDAAGGTDGLRDRLRLHRPVIEPGAGLARRIGEPIANGAGYTLRSAFQARYRALSQAASTTYVWVADGKVHVVTHWISKARAATEASALLRVMAHLLPKDWPGQGPPQVVRAAVF